MTRMTPEALAHARKKLKLTAAALGRRLELEGRDPGRQVMRYENGERRIPGPVAVAIRYMIEEASRQKPPALALASPPEALTPPTAIPEPATTPEPLTAWKSPGRSRRRG